MADSRPLKVVCAIDHDVNPFELGVACEVFGDDRSHRGVPRMDFRVVAPDAMPIRPDYGGGFRIAVEGGLDELRDADVVVLPAFAYRAERPCSQALVDAVREAHDRGAIVLALCTGAFIAAEAGILTGRRATTHWASAARFRAEHPEVELDEDAIFVDEGSVITSAGTAAAIDASIHLIRRLFGAQAASVVARGMVVPPVREGGQSQYATGPVQAERAESLAPLVEWVAGRLEDEHTVASLARHAHLSERTLARRFRDELGTTPMQWVTAQRVRRAQQLLEATDLGLDEVASRVGFGSAALLRHHFAQSLGTSPSRYRMRFSCRVDAA